MVVRHTRLIQWSPQHASMGSAPTYLVRQVHLIEDTAPDSRQTRQAFSDEIVDEACTQLDVCWTAHRDSFYRKLRRFLKAFIARDTPGMDGTRLRPCIRISSSEVELSTLNRIVR